MVTTRRLTYPLLSAIFLAGGMDAATDPEPKVAAVEHLVPRVLGALGVQARTASVVRANGIVQVLAALSLAAGVLPRLSADVLAGSLVPSTIAGHPFWEEKDPAARAAQRVEFLKNLGILAGLVLVATQPARVRRRRTKVAGPAAPRSAS